MLLCLVTSGLCAQEGSVSPYSYFGVGDNRAKGTVENQMMGGIGLFADSIHINHKNPAALGKLGVQFGEDFGITTYAAGVSHKMLRLKSYTEQQSATLTNLEYLSLAFSLKKGWGLGFGVMPYSAVGYNLASVSNDSLVTNRYEGTGGLNRVYLSTGYQFAKNWSVGVTANFNFGTLEYTRIQGVDGVQFGTLDERTSRINGVDFNYALNYTPIFKDKYQLVASFRINTQANLAAENNKKVGSFSLVNGQDIEVLNVDLDAQGLRRTELKIPTTATFGLGYGEHRKWFVGAEYSFQGMSSFSNDFLGVENLEYKDASSLALGGFYIPNQAAFDGYFNRVAYRAGIRLDKTGMVVNNTDINNFGITFGLGLPLGRTFSNMNLGFELGRRGTTSADLLEESYFKINIGMSFNDQWFRKRKIN